ncbi:MAG TPA: hypothetical protein VFM68_03775 [Candidatus Saccharimonadales bacterium]|nr:hypothetical protein [Candidatus Saccharimonadales bacterium]
MSYQNNDPVQALLSAYARATTGKPPVTSYIWKVISVAVVYTLIVIAMINNTDGINMIIASFACFLAVAAIIIACLTYNYENELARSEILQDIRNTSSVSLRQWPMCFNALVQMGVVQNDQDCGVAVKSGTKQVDILVDYLINAIPIESKIKATETSKSFVSISAIRNVATALQNEANARKQAFLEQASAETYDMSDEEACRLMHGTACNYPNGCA